MNPRIAHLTGTPETAFRRCGITGLGLALVVLTCVVFPYTPSISQGQETNVANQELAGATRPQLSRSDLASLRKLDRGGVFAVLGSFDGQGLSSTEFNRNALQLLDPERVPGLAAALEENNQAAAIEAVFAACRQDREIPAQTSSSPNHLRLADALLENKFTFYGEEHQLPEDIDWNHNPGTAHWGHDLNRFGYLNTLTQAYVATRDSRYSRKAVELILDWIAKCELEKCFVGTKYVWGSYLNNAIHCAGWSRCLDVMIPAGQITPDELLRVLKSLHDQLAYLEIVTSGHAGNWPTIGCEGMLQSLAAYPVFRDTDRFVEYCVGTMSTQIHDQILPDGVQDELTPHYHRVVVNNVISVIESLNKLDHPVNPELRETLRTMVRYVQQTCVPDGSKQVAFNDSDPGTPGEILPRLQQAGLADLITPDAELGPDFKPYAGVAFLRQKPTEGDLYLAFDAGPYGRAHQHEDKLGFWLFAYGRNLIVDPGRHLYDYSEKSFIRYLRSTKAHSTIRVNNQDQNSSAHRDLYIAKEPIDLGWQHTDDEIRAMGSYDLGYGPDNATDVTHRREIVFVQSRFWIVFDTVTGNGEHTLESRFQFAPGQLVASGNRAYTRFSDANLLLVAASSTPFAQFEVQKGETDPRSGWYSDSYGKIEPAPALAAIATTALPWRCAVLLFPYRGTEPPAVEFAFDGRQATIKCPELEATVISRLE